MYVFKRWKCGILVIQKSKYCFLGKIFALKEQGTIQHTR